MRTARFPKLFVDASTPSGMVEKRSPMPRKPSLTHRNMARGSVTQRRLFADRADTTRTTLATARRRAQSRTRHTTPIAFIPFVLKGKFHATRFFALL